MLGFKTAKPADLHDSEITLLIDERWDNFVQSVHAQIGYLEENYVRWRRRSQVAKITLIVGGVFIAGDEDGSTAELLSSIFGLSGSLIATIFIIVIFLSGLILIGVSIWVLWRWSKVNREFNKALNPIVFEKAFQVLGFAGHHLTKESVSVAEVTALLNHSQLLTENHNRHEIDDMVSAEHQGRSLFSAELSVKYVTGSGKNRRTKKVFHGVLITHELPRRLVGKTFITTKGDKRGFGKMTWWRRWFKTKKVPRETVLEWNDFNNTLHVATTDATEARYILTTDFMATLYDWWIERKGKIRISFIDNRMYVLYPDKRVKIGTSTPSLAEKDLKQYVLNVARPLWHIQKLMESAEVRFRG